MFKCRSCNLQADVLGTRRRGAHLVAVETLYCHICVELYDVPIRIDRATAERLRPRMSQAWPENANELQLRLIGEVLGRAQGGIPFSVADMRKAPTSHGPAAWRRTLKAIARERSGSGEMAVSAGDLHSVESGLLPGLSARDTAGCSGLESATGFGATAGVWQNIFRAQSIDELGQTEKAILGRWLDTQPMWVFALTNDYGGRINSYYNALPGCPVEIRHPVSAWAGGPCPRCGKRPNQRPEES